MAKKLKVELDGETADNITLLVMKEHRHYLKQELKQLKKGGWMHPEDIVHTKERLIPALNVLIHHFGG